MKLRRIAFLVLPFTAGALDAACSSDDPASSTADAGVADVGSGAATDSGSRQDASTVPDASADASADADATPADSGVDASPAARLDCKTVAGTTNGTYEVDVDGEGPLPLMLLYCDQTWDGGGWTLIESLPASKGPDALPPPATDVGPKPGTLGHLPPAVVKALAARSKQVHVRQSFTTDGGDPDSGTAKWITSKANTAPIENLLRLSALNRDLDASTIQDQFEGPSANAATLHYSDSNSGCSPALIEDAGYPAIYYACGNFSGLHILKGLARFDFSAPNDSIEVYVR